MFPRPMLPINGGGIGGGGAPMIGGGGLGSEICILYISVVFFFLSLIFAFPRDK